MNKKRSLPRTTPKTGGGGARLENVLATLLSAFVYKETGLYNYWLSTRPSQAVFGHFLAGILDLPGSSWLQLVPVPAEVDPCWNQGWAKETRKLSDSSGKMNDSGKINDCAIHGR